MSDHLKSLRTQKQEALDAQEAEIRDAFRILDMEYQEKRKAIKVEIELKYADRMIELDSQIDVSTELSIQNYIHQVSEQYEKAFGLIDGQIVTAYSVSNSDETPVYTEMGKLMFMISDGNNLKSQKVGEPAFVWLNDKMKLTAKIRKFISLVKIENGVREGHGMVVFMFNQHLPV